MTLNEEMYPEWSQTQVLCWLKMILLQNRLDSNTIESFLSEFKQQGVTGAGLKQFKMDETLIDIIKTGFSKRNQAFGIWLVIKSAIRLLGEHKD